MKIILTEAQVIKLKEQLLNERPKKKKKKDNSGERSVKERFLEDVKSEAGQILSQAKVGSEVVIVTGESTPDGDLDFKQCEFKSFAILEVNGDVLTLELMLGEGVSKVESNKHYYLNIYNSIFFNKSNPYIKIGVGTKGNIKNIKLNDFIMVSIYDAFDKNDEFIKHGIQRLEAAEALKNEEYDRLSKEEADKRHAEKEAMDKKFMEEKEKLTPKVDASIEKARTEGSVKWDEQVKQIENSMIFEPSFLGMSNFFIYPKGYIAMDDILSKYGLGVHKDGEGDAKFKIKISDPIFLDIDDEINEDDKSLFPRAWFGSNRKPIIRGGNKPYSVDYDEDNDELSIKKPGSSELNFDLILKLTVNTDLTSSAGEDEEESDYTENEENQKITAKFLLRPLDNEINNGQDFMVDPSVVVEIIKSKK